MERCKDLELIKTLVDGGIAVLPSDTLYGIMAKASNKDAVERVYEVRSRDRTKRCPILIPDAGAVRELGLHVPIWAELLLERAWPGPITIEFETTSLAPEHLSRGHSSFAVRVPDDEDLRCLLQKTGPLLAPSANPEGLPPAATVHWAKEYFGDQVDYYFDGGYRSGDPSTLIGLKDHGIEVFREGAGDVSMLRDLVREV